MTVTVTDLEVLPPVPVQVKVYVVVLVGKTLAVPETATGPPQPVQDVALVDDQFKVEYEPLAMEVGEAVKVVIVGAGTTVTVAVAEALPPGPVQFKVYVVVAVIEFMVSV